MKLWFTSDLHFGHRNVIGYCERPFADVVDMNDELVRRWNDRVAKQDIVYVIGDFALGCRPKDIVHRLNGSIVLVKGNHDHRKEIKDAGFSIIVDNSFTWNHPDHGGIYFRHVPYPNDVETGREGKSVGTPAGCSYHLCGHVHKAWKRKGNVINVGVDVWDYQPVSLEELLNSE